MSCEPWLDFDPVSQAQQVSRSKLIVHTDFCALPDQARKVYSLLRGPKQLYWTTGAHLNFYDWSEKVREASEKAARHFRTDAV